jgi:hypothetical protein
MNIYESTGLLNFTGNESLDLIILLVILVWLIIWKGKALWIASKQDSVKWFWGLLIFQTLGILDIFYIYVFSKKDRLIKNSEESFENKLENQGLSGQQ